MGSLKNIVGNRYNDLTVLMRAEDYLSPSGYRSPRWICLCVCGKEHTVVGSSLKSGAIKSCGCSQKEKHIKRLTLHNKSGTIEYDCYRAMLSRCTDPNNKRYNDYGGRGIAVWSDWLEQDGKGFLNFLRDLGERPSNDYSLERLDVNGNYCPENCIWINNKLQSRNRRKRRTNKSGVTGVSFERNYKRYKSSWRRLDGTQRTKSFSTEKYGEELAFFMACEYREHQIMLLNLQGAGYSESHGK